MFKAKYTQLKTDSKCFEAYAHAVRVVLVDDDSVGGRLTCMLIPRSRSNDIPRKATHQEQGYPVLGIKPCPWWLLAELFIKSFKHPSGETAAQNQSTRCSRKPNYEQDRSWSAHVGWVTC